MIMPRILLVECTQEISSFNPRRSSYHDFSISRGAGLLARRGTNSYLGGALAVLDERADVTLVPTFSAAAPSTGPLAAEGWQRLRQELLAAVREGATGIDGVYFSLHGAMGAEGELDPEGALLSAVREIVGPEIPIVISLDLHGIFTARMMDAVDGFTVLKTYPHIDFGDTGARAARLLLEILDRKLRPAILRLTIPALVRGDELVTKTGCYGDRLLEITALERAGRVLSGGLFIGNPFTDVPELMCQVVLCTAGDPADLRDEALAIAHAFWRDRARMQAKLIGLPAAISQARGMPGTVIFTDAADATSSGAAGDSNAILRALIETGYPGRALLPIVDPTAAEACHAAGCGASVTVRLGGADDPERFQPVEVTGTVKLLSTGSARLETMGVAIDSGPTAVLVAGKLTIVVMSLPAFLFDRAVFYANGCDPRAFDLVVVKSPHCEHHMFDAWCSKNFNIDAPGATSANLPTLGHTVCARPVYPLEPDTAFVPRVEFHRRG
jgi:microcystin degradation protein MlrC